MKYKTYTEEFDEIVKIGTRKCRGAIETKKKSSTFYSLKVYFKIGKQITRKLLAKQNRSWNFDLEEGLLDTSKLTRVIMDPFNSLSFKEGYRI